MKIQENISLKKYNTFGIDVKAKRFTSATSLTELKNILLSEKELFLIGGGSNMLLTKDVETLTVLLNLKGIEIVNEDDDWAYVSAAAGENWHEFVRWCIAHDFGGLENLSLIPGNVGTAPIQNIGAYGVEIKDCMESLEAVNIATGTSRIFLNEDCEFGYRDSVFKKNLKGQFIITKVLFKLSKKEHQFNVSYGAIKSYLDVNAKLSLKAVSNAIIEIRNSKLPDPKTLGNSGSFFKNPIIDLALFETIKCNYPAVPHYPATKLQVKVPAGWLIEKCGFKGKRYGDAGVHKDQALVLVNYGEASGKEILDLAKAIKESVYKKFEVILEFEVNIF